MCSQGAARLMMAKRTRCIINIASHAGMFYSRGQGVHYAASKAAIIQMTRVLAFELGLWESGSMPSRRAVATLEVPPLHLKLKFL